MTRLAQMIINGLIKDLGNNDYLVLIDDADKVENEIASILDNYDVIDVYDDSTIYRIDGKACRIYYFDPSEI